MSWHLDSTDCAPGVTHFLARLHKQTIAILYMRVDWSIEQKVRGNDESQRMDRR